VPTAEPSGEYTILSFVDLSPAFGMVEDRTHVMIRQPPPDILDRRLEELKSEDREVRNIAVMDLAHFSREGDRVFPALLSCLHDSCDRVRHNALSGLSTFPDRIGKESPLLLKIVKNRDEADYLRYLAAYYLGGYAPKDSEVEKALREAARSITMSHWRQCVEEELERYLKRVNEDPGEDGSE
jgi:HEAT repeat protein